MLQGSCFWWEEAGSSRLPHDPHQHQSPPQTRQSQHKRTNLKGRPCLHIVYVDGVACLHIHYVDAVSCLHIVYVDATACLHIVQVICYLVIAWFCVNLPQLLQHQLSKFWACECQMHIVPVWSCHNCCSKGGVAVTKALRILALPRLARPPRPPILALWWIWRQKVRKCDSQQLMTKRTYFGVKIIFGEISTDWELNPSSRSPPSSHLLSPNDFEALSPSFFFCNFVICFVLTRL